MNNNEASLLALEVLCPYKRHGDTVNHDEANRHEVQHKYFVLLYVGVCKAHEENNK